MGFAVKIDTNKNIAYSGAIGEVGSVPALYACNDAGSALVSMGFRATDLRFATQADERVRITSGGFVGIKTSSPRYDLTVAGDNATAVGIALDNANGSSTLDLAALGSGYNSHGAVAGSVWLYSPDHINIGGATGSTNEVRILGSGGIRHTFYNTGATFNATTGGTFHLKSGGHSQLSFLTCQYLAQNGTNIAQANVQIVNSAFGALVFVRGYSPTGYPTAQFCDLVYFGYNASPTILAQQTVAGTPPNRTYTGSGYALYLNYSSNVLNTKVHVIQSH